MNEKTLSFEEAYAELEHILERMSSGTVSLEESIQCYERADGLIQLCQKRLNDAEQKIEVLIKNRDGSLALNEKDLPIKEIFNVTALRH